MAKKTKYRKPDLESLRLQLGYSPLAPTAGGAATGDKHLVEKYEAKFVRDGLTKGGKRIRIDERTQKEYDPAEAKRYINLNKYGTETPEKDFEYLNRKDIADRKEQTGPMGIRRFFSEKGTGGSKFVDLEHAAYLKQEREELEQLKKETSFAIDGDLVRQAEMYGGDESGRDFSAEYMAAMEDDGDGTGDGTSGGNDTLEVNNGALTEALQAVSDAKKNLLIITQGNKKKDDITNLGGQEYTTNFREAFRNANKTQAWADTMDSAPLEKSNVFSQAAMDWGQYKQGDTLGVMTRNQRRAYDEAVSAMNEQKLADEATGGSGVYGEKGKETTTEWTTDQEANEKGKVLGTDAQKSTESPIKETSNILKDKELEKGIKMGG